MNRFIQLNGIAAAVLGLATALDVAQTVAADQGQGHAAVMTSGNGVAVSGTWDASGFHGVYSGPQGTGRVVQPANSIRPTQIQASRGGVVIGPGAVFAVAGADDEDDDEPVAAIAGVGASAFAGAGASAGSIAGAGGAVAIAGPNGVAVGVPGAPVLIVGSGDRVWTGNPPANRARSQPPQRPWNGNIQELRQSGKPLPTDRQAARLPAPPPPSIAVAPSRVNGGATSSNSTGQERTGPQ